MPFFLKKPNEKGRANKHIIGIASKDAILE
jgi:uncharacterized protein YggU (UPF0235/DUF167 family)